MWSGVMMEVNVVGIYDGDECVGDEYGGMNVVELYMEEEEKM